jgi:hypothetical protein
MIIANARYAFWKGFNILEFLDVMHIITNNNKFMTKLTADKIYIAIFSQNVAYIGLIILNMVLLSI